MLVTRNEALKGEIIPFLYNKQLFSLKPQEAIDFAISINDLFKQLILNYSTNEARSILSNDPRFSEFSSKNGFPKLFLMATEKKTGTKQLEYLSQLAYYRTQVNLGHMTEMDGEKKALEIAVKAKMN